MVLPHRDVHARLQLSGHLILVAVVLGWLLLIWGGFALLFASDPASVVDGTTSRPTDVVTKLAYAAGALAGAGAGYVSSSGGWQFANNLAALAGLTWAALTLTYLFQVVTAASQRRAMSIRVLGISDDPVAMAAVGPGRPDLGLLGQHLITLAEEVALIARYHHALPVLVYFHVGERDAAIEVAVAVLDEALTLEAVGDHTPAATGPMRAAIGELLASVDVGDDVGEPPPAAGSRLAAFGLPLSEQELAAAVDHLSHRRRKLRAFVQDRGWDWSRDVLRQEG